MRIRLLAVVGIAGMIAGCGGSGPSVDVDDVERVVLTEGEAVSVTVVDKRVIGLFAEALGDAVIDDGKYAVLKDRTLDFQGGGKSLLKLQFHDVLFDIGETQYSDETNTIGGIAGGMLDAKAPLYGEVECEKTLPADGMVTMKYTVTNVGEKSVNIAATFRALIRLLLLPEDEEQPHTDVLSRQAAKHGHFDIEGKEPVTLAPGKSHVYTLTFYAHGVGAGERALSIKFEHRDEEPPADEVVPPSVSGIVLAFH
jgi:hypothetical protein